MNGLHTLYTASHHPPVRLQTSSKIISLNYIPAGYKPIQHIDDGSNRSSLVLAADNASDMIIITASTSKKTGADSKLIRADKAARDKVGVACTKGDVESIPSAYGDATLTHTVCVMNHHDLSQDVVRLDVPSVQTIITVHVVSGNQSNLDANHEAERRIIGDLHIADRPNV